MAYLISRSPELCVEHLNHRSVFNRPLWQMQYNSRISMSKSLTRSRGVDRFLLKAIIADGRNYQPSRIDNCLIEKEDEC